MKYELKEPFTKDKLKNLRAGDTLLLTGTIYAARDAAHKRLMQLIKEEGQLPFDIRDQILFYAGPTPARPGNPIGSVGPTTSYKMDPFTPALLQRGLSGMIGKGPRSGEVKACARREGAVYLAAIGGTAALMAGCVRSAETAAFADLGEDAVLRLYVERMPLVVACDTEGGDIYAKEEQSG